MRTSHEYKASDLAYHISINPGVLLCTTDGLEYCVLQPEYRKHFMVRDIPFSQSSHLGCELSARSVIVTPRAISFGQYPGGEKDVRSHLQRYGANHREGKRFLFQHPSQIEHHLLQVCLERTESRCQVPFPGPVCPTIARLSNLSNALEGSFPPRLQR